jgi:cytochrome c oxidase subunit 3
VTTFLLALLFIGAQMLGWKEMFNKGIYFDGEANGSYLILLSGLHLLHFFGGMIFFLVVYFRAFHAYRDAVHNLVYITDPYEKMMLDLLSYYWHAMSAIWIGLFLIFLSFTF